MSTTFFCDNVTVLAATDTNLSDSYNGTNPIISDTLPETKTNGTFDEETVIKPRIKDLIKLNKIPTPPDLSRLQSAPFSSPSDLTPLSTYVTKLQEFDNSLKAEYCFYEARYLYALNSFLSALAAAGTGTLQTSGATVENIQNKLNTTKNLNKKLIYLTQIGNTLEKDRYSKASDLQSGNDSINTKLSKQQEDLATQRQILTKESASADLYKRMVEYTAEKNRANQNLLVMYGILNVTALAMIFYVARS